MNGSSFHKKESNHTVGSIIKTLSPLLTIRKTWDQSA